MFSLHLSNNDFNKSQSSNDTFPSMILIATIFAMKEKLLPAINEKKFLSLLSESVYLKVNIKTQYIFNYIK